MSHTDRAHYLATELTVLRPLRRMDESTTAVGQTLTHPATHVQGVRESHGVHAEPEGTFSTQFLT